MGCSRTALLLCLLAVAAAGLPPAAAVICGSYTTPADCNGKFASSGQCGWTGGSCRAVRPLAEGWAGVDSIEEPMFAVTSAEAPAQAPMAAPAPAPEAEGPLGARGLLQAPASVCVDKPTPEGFTCEQQKSWGKCAEPWMIAGSFCRRTCNLCAPTGQPQTTGQPPAQQEVEAAILKADPWAAAPLLETDQGQQQAGMSVEGQAPANVVETAAQAPPTAEAPPTSQFCTQPPVTGPCRAALRSWYYDAAARTCKPFLYGGCQGNDNLFETFDACDAASKQSCQGVTA